MFNSTYHKQHMHVKVYDLVILAVDEVGVRRADDPGPGDDLVLLRDDGLAAAADGGQVRGAGLQAGGEDHRN